MSESDIDAAAIGRVLDAHYFAAEEARIERIPLGMDAVNFLVAHGGRKYVLKWYEGADTGAISEEMAAMRWLSGRGVAVPDVVAARDGALCVRIDGDCAVLLEYVEGEALGEDVEAGLEVARFLARFHAESVQYPHAFCAERTEFARLEAFKGACTARGDVARIDGLAAFIDDYGREIELFTAAHQRAGDLEIGIVHHDLHGGNFLAGVDGRIAAMLDFSEAHRGYLVFDLAVLAYWAFDHDANRFDMGQCRALLAAYGEHRTIPAAERTLLPHAILLYLATDATGYIAPKLRGSAPFVISQCNMYTGFCKLRSDCAWMEELDTIWE